MTDSLWERTERAVEAIRSLDTREPAIALVLGSGLGAYADDLDNKTTIPYGEIPGFPVSTVSGHSGTLVIGEVNGLPVAVMQGRVHLYEGHDAKTVTFPLRVLWRLGARALIVTNSAGSLNPKLKPGDLVVLRDHLNLTGQNPLAEVTRVRVALEKAVAAEDFEEAAGLRDHLKELEARQAGSEDESP